MTPQPANKSNSVTTTVRLDRAVSDQLRRMAFDHRVSQNTIITIAVTGYLQRNGYLPELLNDQED